MVPRSFAHRGGDDTADEGVAARAARPVGRIVLTREAQRSRHVDDGRYRRRSSHELVGGCHREVRVEAAETFEQLTVDEHRRGFDDRPGGATLERHVAVRGHHTGAGVGHAGEHDHKVAAHEPGPIGRRCIEQALEAVGSRPVGRLLEEVAVDGVIEGDLCHHRRRRCRPTR
jgi:hypothetical protein